MNLWSLWCKVTKHQWRKLASDGLGGRNKVCKRCGLVREVKPRKVKNG
jgi:hypothetical protein